MAKIAIVYQSGGGHTRALAEHVLKGAASWPGATAELIEIKGEQVTAGRWDHPPTLAKLNDADAIIFGCATYMGSTSAIYKAFLEKAFAPWAVQAWKDKIAAGFTNSASQNGDKLNTLTDLALFAMQMGMIWVGVADGPGNNWSGGTVNDINRMGSWLGLMSQSNGDQGPDLAPPQGDRLTAERFGKRVAALTGKFLGEPGYTTERAKLL